MRLAPALSASTIFASFVLLGCPTKSTGTPDATTGDGGDASAEAGADAAGGGGDDVEPVYPVEDNAPAVPLAQKLCEGLNTMPEGKRSACCKATAGITFASECTRMLSAAMRHKAIEADAKEVDACIAAFEKTLDGCDWVGPFPPGPPPACLGILKGKTAEGHKCRSTLECAGELHCIGLGPTTIGKCGAPSAGGESCGGTVDPLVGFARQTDSDKRHPQCKERCIKHQCQPAVADGAPCLISGDCQEGLQCLPVPGAAKDHRGIAPKKCVAGKTPGKEGDPCPGGVCESGMQCIRGKCAARKAGGEACTDDFECRGGCLRDDAGTKGKCGPRCDIR